LRTVTFKPTKQKKIKRDKKININKKDDEYDDEVESKNDSEEDNENNDENNTVMMNNRTVTTRFLFSFEDIENSLQIFNDDEKQNIQK